MFGTPNPAPRPSADEADTDLAPASELSEHGMLSEEEVVMPRLRPGRPEVTVPPAPARRSWVGVAIAGALSTVGLLLGAGVAAVAVVALLAWWLA